MNFLLKIIKKILNKPFKETSMESEIYEQPEIIDRLIRKYLSKNGCVNLDIPENINKIALIASGSSYHSATDRKSVV